jgi:uncharacterized lipoprotein
MKKLLSIVIVTILAGCSSMDMSGGGARGSGGNGFNSTGYPATNAPFDANDPYHGG